ncbi:unnamed protein product [Meganyctiphanes norvegica]|uniref:Exophilin 5 n=1 Tax=Meganyctiphanes norvegica TaxID=48144 RepID=A0AAV2QD60_MEGNR
MSKSTEISQTDNLDIGRAGGWKRRCRPPMLKVSKTPNPEIKTMVSVSDSDTSPSISSEKQHVDNTVCDENVSTKRPASESTLTYAKDKQDSVEVAEEALLSDIMVDPVSPSVSTSSSEHEHHTSEILLQSNEDQKSVDQSHTIKDKCKDQTSSPVKLVPIHCRQDNSSMFKNNQQKNVYDEKVSIKQQATEKNVQSCKNKVKENKLPKKGKFRSFKASDFIPTV